MFNPNDPLALPQIQMDLARGQRDLQFADALMNAGYVPNSGALGAISQIAQAFMGRKLSRKADEKISDALKRQFEADNARAAQEAQRKAEEEDRSYRKAIERRAQEAQMMGLQGPAAQRYAVTGEVPKEAQRKFVNGFWVDESSGQVQQVPEYLDAQAKLRAAGRTQVNVNGNAPPPTEFQKALDKKDAEYFGTLRDAATTASQTLDQVKVIEDVLNTAQTGKIPQALAMAGQYFGTEAGANMQTFQAATNRMVLDLAGKMKGALSDSDRRMLEQSVPSFGMDPRANQVVLGLIKKGAQNAQSTYQAADQFASERGGLRGFVPPMAMNIDTPKQQGYQVGQVIELNGKKYRVIGGDPSDPEVEEIQ